MCGEPQASRACELAVPTEVQLLVAQVLIPNHHLGRIRTFQDALTGDRSGIRLRTRVDQNKQCSIPIPRKALAETWGQGLWTDQPESGDGLDGQEMTGTHSLSSGRESLRIRSCKVSE